MTEVKDCRAGPTIKFKICDQLMKKGKFTDYYGREIVPPIECNLPRGHTGPHALMKYADFEYEEK